MNETTTVPAPCPSCLPVGFGGKPSRGTPKGCTVCQWTGEQDWSGPAECAERRFLDSHFAEHGAELGDQRPGNLVCPGAWNGHGTMVGASGAIENGRGVTREFAVEAILPGRIQEITLDE